MSGQESQERQHGRPPEEDGQETAGASLAERKSKLDEDVDALLDDIDDVLEENAEEFVRSFVQKGGQ